MNASEKPAVETDGSKHGPQTSLPPLQPVGSLTQLGLATSNVLSGSMNKASGAYQEVLSPWKDADSDVSRPEKAKTEYAKLLDRQN